MNIPYVKVNNQKEFERVVNKMGIETGLPNIHKYDTYYPIISANDDRTNLCGWIPTIDKKVISADEYLTGTRENFTLDDLEDGMVVELRDCDENLFFIFNKTLIGMGNYDKIIEYNSDLTNKHSKSLDIIKVYKPKEISSMRNILNRNNLVFIFDAESHRNKSKISQRKLEIENEIKKLQEELNNL